MGREGGPLSLGSPTSPAPPGPGASPFMWNTSRGASQWGHGHSARASRCPRAHRWTRCFPPCVVQRAPCSCSCCWWEAVFRPGSWWGWLLCPCLRVSGTPGVTPSQRHVGPGGHRAGGRRGWARLRLGPHLPWEPLLTPSYPDWGSRRFWMVLSPVSPFSRGCLAFLSSSLAEVFTSAPTFCYFQELFIFMRQPRCRCPASLGFV